MQEHLIHPEHKPERVESFEHEEIKSEHTPENISESNEKIDVEKLHRHAIEHAVSAEEISVGENLQDDRLSPIMAQKELKTDAYNRTLKKIHSHLNPLERGLSKVVHQPVIDAVSDFSGKTLARPSGLLGGGLLALIGSSLLLYMSKHYGFEYNFSFFIILFTSGFFVGILAELVLKLAKKKNV